ncbi:MAG: hypothetical protein JW795_16425 [Chitinivibrionales bacterium]|nr:hypothetical protein [Chitinivibrionales bacterium]
MPYCSRCGVEVNKNVTNCILCHAPIQVLEPGDKPSQSIFPPPSSKRPMARGERRFIAWEIMSAVSCVAASAVCSIDLLFSGRLTWSVYPLAGICATWVYFSLTLQFIKRPLSAISGWTLSTVLLLLAFDSLDRSITWFFSLGLPVTLMGGALLVLSFLTFMRCSSVTFIIMILLSLAALFSVGLDFVISKYLGHTRIGWSLIVVAAIAPLEVLLAFHIAIMRKHIDLKRFFHV